MSTEYMKENGFYEQLEKTAVVPVVVLEKVEDAVPMANALVKGGLPAAEVTFRTAAAADCIHEMAEKCPDILVGAGTVVNLEQCKRALSRSIHAMALELRARDRQRDELARGLAGTHAIERLKRQHGTQTQRIAPKDACHGVIHHEQRMGLAGRSTQSAQIGHTQTKPADRVDEPPQVRTFDIKRSIKALGRGSKRRNRRLPHQHHIATIKAERKRIGKVVRKSNQAITGPHNPQQRQRRRHMRASNKTRLTRAGPCSPGLF